MRKLVVDNVEITDDSDCYVIAEIGHNHQGSVEQCKKLFKAAKAAGANAVKLQKRNNRALFTKEMYDSAYNSENAYAATYGAHREFLEFGRDEYLELKKWAKELDITFFSTAFDLPSADFLEALDLPAYKIASGDIINIPLLRRVAKFGRPMFVSTGGASLEDVRRAYDAIMPINRQLCIMQCTASYPAAFEELNLRVIETYRKTFPDIVIGLSAHDSGIAMALVGFMLGARAVEKGVLTNKVRRLRADEESAAVLAPADTEVDEDGKIVGKYILARKAGDFHLVEPKEIQYLDVSPKQIVGVSASLIPFLEHDDANRALMGSNMMRQAVPLVWTEPPVVATGMEIPVARNSGMVVRARDAGVVTYADSLRAVVKGEIGEIEYPLRKFVGLNERTCLNQRPCVRPGDRVKRGDVLADGAGTHDGELSLGKNILVAFMSWEGYNFEDAIIVSERLLKDDVYTSVHIDEFESEIRETKLGREEFTRDIPNVSEKALRNLDESGVVRVGTRVRPGDILVGKVAPKSKTELSPEEKLLHAIFGRAGEDVKNDSLEVPSGTEGIVLHVERLSRRVNQTEDQRQAAQAEMRKVERNANADFKKVMRECMEKVQAVYRGELKDPETNRVFAVPDDANINQMKALRDRLKEAVIHTRESERKGKATQLMKDFYDQLEAIESERTKLVNQLTRGDELPTGVLEMVRVYIATKRQLSVGDKRAGRHGNKGVVSKILPAEDMPFLEDGTPVDIILNPLGVPSRMNAGQILETHLGWAARTLGFQAVSPVFDGCSEGEIEKALAEAGLPKRGKTPLVDGRTGELFDQEVTVGYIYMMKLHHLVDDKVHARATGPYSLITQQPLGGKARFGGQRFGEMEVWALEAYGAAHILQELLTVKSDDVDGRTKIYESMVKGENLLEAGTPVSFDVLCNEIKGLCLNIELEKKQAL